MVNLLHSLPNELIANIANYIDAETKTSLLVVDQKIRKVLLLQLTCMKIAPLDSPLFYLSSANAKKDALVKMRIERTKLTKIIFGSESHPFKYEHLPYLQSLLSHLENQSSGLFFKRRDFHKLNFKIFSSQKNNKNGNQSHFFSAIKKIEYTEINLTLMGYLSEKKTKILNQRFLNTLGNKDLESFRINSHEGESTITADEIQPVLNRSPHLKNFVFKGSFLIQIGFLSFSNQSQLTQVTLLNWNGPPSTLASLKHCKKLKELTIAYNGFSSDKIKVILLKDHPWDLNRLKLKGIAPDNDAELNMITKKLPHLTDLDLRLDLVSEEGMEMLGKNCRLLKSLKFKNRNLTDSGLDRLTKQLANLEVISFNISNQLTKEGIAAIEKNCQNLQSFNLLT